MFIENEYTVKISEIGKDNKATNKSILSYLEDVGGIHSNIAGYGILDIPQTHLSWILLEWKLKLIKRPNYAEKIKVKTWSKPSVKVYSYRDFEIYDEAENIIGTASSKWVLLDLEKRRMVKIGKEIDDKYEIETNKSVFENNIFEKIKEPEKYQSEITYTVKRVDIDVNNHMHNLNYIELANEALPEEIYKNNQFNEIRISYKREIKLGETVRCKYAFENDSHIIVIKNEEDTFIHAIIEMK